MFYQFAKLYEGFFCTTNYQLASSVGRVIREESCNSKHITTLFLWIIGWFVFKCIPVNFSWITGQLIFIKSSFGKPLTSFIVIDEVLLKRKTERIGQEPITSLENRGLSDAASAHLSGWASDLNFIRRILSLYLGPITDPVENTKEMAATLSRS